MEKRKLKLVLEYDGTGFSGWQVQPEARTVQKVTEDAIGKVLQHPVRIIAAGRTDAGVHASGQVAHFTTSSEMEPAVLKKALNGLLPRDVTVRDLTETHADFHARFDATARTYRYTLSNRRISIGCNYAWHVPYRLDIKLLEHSTRPLEGHCNLRGFSKGQDDEDFSTVILKNHWTFDDNFMIFEIRAIRFFHHAVRSIVGSAVEVARGKASPDLLSRILETHDRKLSGPTAPAQGLCLMKVDY